MKCQLVGLEIRTCQSLMNIEKYQMKKLIKRIVFLLLKSPLRLVDFINPRLYMKIYPLLLSQLGVKFVGTPRYISALAVFDDFSKISFGDGTVVSKNVIFNP